MKALIIEDEAELAKSITEYLKEEDYLCETAGTFYAAMDKINSHFYDCIILDLMLPGGNGFTILEELKKLNRQEGVIIISARDGLEDKIKGLQMGADDYMAKPFHLSELGARIYSVIRRKHFENNNVVSIKELKIDLLEKSVRVNENLINLTKKEYELLLFFVSNKNRIISKSALAEHLSGDMADMMDNHSFVYAHVKNLKKKLTEANCPDYIKTVYAMGYKWES